MAPGEPVNSTVSAVVNSTTNLQSREPSLGAAWWRSMRAVLLPWFIFRGALFSYIYAVRMLGEQEGSYHGAVVGELNHKFWDCFIHWDAGWYERVARSGYADPTAAAFFPAYPYAVRALSHVGISLWASSLWVSNACLLLALSVLHVQLCKRTTKSQADFGVLGVLLFPTTVFFSAFYAESMYFAFVLAAFWFGHERRWWLAALAAAFASATRSAGVFLGPSLALMFFLDDLAKKRQGLRRDWRPFLWLGVAPMGLGVVMWMQHVQVGDAFAFVHVQASWGRGSGVWPWLPIPRDLLDTNLDCIRRADAVFAALGLLCAAGAWRLKHQGEALFALVCVVIPLTTGSCWSCTRFVSVLPAVYICWSHAAYKPLLRQWLLVASTLACAIYTTRFVSGGWAG